MLRHRRISPLIKAQLFSTRSLQDVQRFLAALDPPVVITLDQGMADKISYPKPVENFTPSESKKRAKREEKARRKLERRIERGDLDEMEDLVAG